jgi:hypothetical protein
LLNIMSMDYAHPKLAINRMEGAQQDETIAVRRCWCAKKS